jgi:hypothetical protein
MLQLVRGREDEELMVDLNDGEGVGETRVAVREMRP